MTTTRDPLDPEHRRVTEADVYTQSLNLTSSAETSTHRGRPWALEQDDWDLLYRVYDESDDAESGDS